jgi:D,D-heptose 1,7-bisphosphate phosphatase
MTSKAIFLDRDGTINIDKGYTYKIEDLEFIPKSVEGLKKLAKSEYKLIILTNQSGIARGYHTEEDYLNFREALHSKLLSEGVLITAEYFCPHRSEDNCRCRKPKTGMLEQAAIDHNLNLNESWMIGDSLIDILAGMNSFCKTIHILTGVERSSPVYANFVAKDMIEAADYILSFQE